MSKIERIAVITGVNEEAEALLPLAPAEHRDSPLGLVRKVEHCGKQISILCPGIGKVHAAGAAIYLHEAIRPDLFMVIGTAGQVSQLAGDCFYLDEALQADYGTLDNSRGNDGFTHYNAGAWPIGPSDWKPFRALPMPPELNLPPARIATADMFVKCPERSGYLRDELKADLVDMETAAVAQICGRLDRPWAGIKAITDGADGDSGSDFHANLIDAANRAAEATDRFIRLL
ncbi:MAG: 5'-methylthioadenosine/S-adenosylhomocysteine nucleosidase [Pseudomonadota bacterium]